MDLTNQILTRVEADYEKFAQFPDRCHLLCPKISDDDYVDYGNTTTEDDLPLPEKIRRIEDGKERTDTTFRASLLLGLSEDLAGDWLPKFANRLNDSLRGCDNCVRRWHMGRTGFLAQLRQEYNENTAQVMEARYDEVDFARITAGLTAVEQWIRQQEIAGRTPITTKALMAHDPTYLLAVYEALCCLRYLGLPDHRAKFNHIFTKIQEKKVLKLQNVVPAMTPFLFDDDPIRRKFAVSGWQKVPPGSLSEEEWDWAVKEELKQAAAAALNPQVTTVPKRQTLWEGVLLIANTLNDSLMTRKLCDMREPDLVRCAVESLNDESEHVLALIYQIISCVLRKAPAAFWAKFTQFPLLGVAQSFVTARRLGVLLSNADTMMVISEDGQPSPAAICWVKPFMDSIRPSDKETASSFLIPMFLKDFRNDLRLGNPGRLAAVRAGLDIMHLTMTAFRDPNYKINTQSSLLLINQAINQVVKYKETLTAFLRIRPGDDLNLCLSVRVLDVFEAALSLDAEAFHTEWIALYSSTSGEVQNHVVRSSAELWETILSVLSLGNTLLARQIMSSSVKFLMAARLIPQKHQKLPQNKLEWNETYEKTADVVGRVMQRLGDFSPSDQSVLCNDQDVMRPITQAILNSEPLLNEGGLSFLKAATDSLSRSEAVSQLIMDHLAPFLVAYNNAVQVVMKEHFSWDPVVQILHYDNDILSTFCNELQTRELNANERTAVEGWWTLQWIYIHKSLQKMEEWSKHFDIGKTVLQDYVRLAMEFAEQMLQQDDVFASALSETADASTHTEKMRALLVGPQKCAGLSKMIRLRDTYLISTVVKILVKLLNRLRQHGMKAHPEIEKLIKDSCIPVRGSKGKYMVNTNLNDQQRAELVQALGLHRDEDEDDVITKIKPIANDKGKKQITIDSWSRSGASGAPDLLEFTPNLAKKASVLDQMKSAQAAEKTKQVKATKAALTAELLRKKQEEKAQTEAQVKLKQAAMREKRAREKAEQDKEKAAIIAKAKALRQPAPLVPGEGSGLRALGGIRGKEHAPAQQKSELMVNSDSEPDDEGDPLQELGKRSTARQPHMTESERRLALLPRGPVKKARLIRSNDHYKARVAPNMNGLHRAILEWDIFHEGADPPNASECRKVAESYTSPAGYKQTFMELLIHEAWRSFVTAKDECTQKPLGIQIGGRMNADNFQDLTVHLPVSEVKSRFLSEGDIVLLSKGADPLNSPDEENCLARVQKFTYKKDNVQVLFRTNPATGASLKPARIQPGLSLFMIKITNMTTIEREYAALESLKYYDLCQEILDAEPSPMLNWGEDRLHEVMENYELNLGQAKAILGAYENDGFTLVQGPPGTGKTKTIVAMVGSLLSDVLSTQGGVALPRPTSAAPHQQGPRKKKLLICAPSNAAVDELVVRLKQGVRTLKGSHVQINVVRLGRSDVINAAVKDVTLEELVNAEMEGQQPQNGGAASERERLHKRAGELKARRAELQAQIDKAESEGDLNLRDSILRDALKPLRDEQMKIGKQIDADKDSGITRERESKIRMQNIQQKIIDQAHVLCATLSGSGHQLFTGLNNIDFETVIIDEAAQCVELSALIPLKYGCTKCVLVGDPKQLPPTVLSQSAARYGYDQSLFVRMQRNHPEWVHLLDKQYRMHPEISQFPSQEFYEGRLEDGKDMWTLRQQPWHESLYLGPYRFFDIRGTQERGARGQSLINDKEIDVAISLYNRLTTDYGDISMDGKVGIITPYKAQLQALRGRFSRAYGDDIVKKIDFNTTDAFQGRECEIIIFSCVRASSTGGIGFMTDIRRMNVGLTRAKSSLWILGDSMALKQGDYWAKLIDNAKSRNLLTSGNMESILRTCGPKAPAGSLRPNSKPPSANGVLSGRLGIADVPPESVGVQPEAMLSEAYKAAHLPQPATGKDGFVTSSLLPGPNTVVIGPSQLNPRVSNSIPRGFGRVNERGDNEPPQRAALDGAPVIQTSRPAIRKKPSNPTLSTNAPPKGPANSGLAQSKKRPHPPGNDAPSKRVHSVSKQDTDPSAMEVLGIVPPERPPPPTTNRPMIPGGRPGQARPAGPGILPRAQNRSKKSTDPFIHRKPNRKT